MRYAEVDANNKVVNVVEIAQGGIWNPGPGLRVFPSDAADFGDTFNGVTLTKKPAARPPVMPRGPTLADIISILTPAQQAALQAIVDAK